MKRILLGMLTPSSNTALEPLTSAMVAGLPEVSAHFGRFRVTEISLRDAALGQFELEPILHAARLLADARVDVIAWNGTSSGWRGFADDVRLCAQITEATGIPATTSVLALNEIFAATEVTRFGLATPYIPEIQDAIMANYRQAGFDCVAERHLDERVNFAFAEASADQIAGMVRDVAAAEPHAITTFCTNLRAAPLVEALERETGIPVYDTISVVVWKSLLLAGADPRRVTGWGRLFGDPRLSGR
jgi:maleate isomerase